MSKTRIAVGIASPLAIAQTDSPESCVALIIGGSVGDIVADCDIAPNRARKDTFLRIGDADADDDVAALAFHARDLHVHLHRRAGID